MMLEITEGPNYRAIPQDSNRLRIYYISYRMVWSMLLNGADYPQAVCIITSKLPKDVKIWNIFHKPQSLSLGLIVEHTTFDPVLDGQDIPSMPFVFEEKMFLVVGNDKFVCNWECIPTPDLQQLKAEINRELHRRWYTEKLKV